MNSNVLKSLPGLSVEVVPGAPETSVPRERIQGEDRSQIESRGGLFPSTPLTYLEEMNFVEVPVSLLTRDDSGIRNLEVAPGVVLNGNPEAVRVALQREGFPVNFGADGKKIGIWRDDAGGLPTSMGEHVLLALVALTWDRNRFLEETIEFEIPELV